MPTHHTNCISARSPCHQLPFLRMDRPPISWPMLGTRNSLTKAASFESNRLPILGLDGVINLQISYSSISKVLLTSQNHYLNPITDCFAVHVEADSAETTFPSSTLLSKCCPLLGLAFADTIWKLWLLWVRNRYDTPVQNIVLWRTPLWKSWSYWLLNQIYLLAMEHPHSRDSLVPTKQQRISMNKNISLLLLHELQIFIQ